MNFSIKTMFVKGVKYAVIFALPMLVNAFIFEFPDIAQITVGGLLVMLVNFLKIKVGVRI